MSSRPQVLSEIVSYVHAGDGFRLALTELVSERSLLLRDGRPAFLLIPGFAQNRLAFSAGELPSLLISRGARVFAGELRGHGRSVAPVGDDRRWSLATHLDLDLPALISRARQLANVSGVHFVGHSMGGMLGVALLARAPSLVASLTTFAAPLVLDRHAPIVRLAALVAAPALKRFSSVPMDLFLRTFASMLIARGERTPMRALYEQIALASSRTADASLLAEILSSSEQESAMVLAELAEMAIDGRAVIAGIDLLDAARAASQKIACVVGTNDVLAPRASVRGLESGAGPRLVVEIADALHVDLVVGRHARSLVDQLWAFLFPPV